MNRLIILFLLFSCFIPGLVADEGSPDHRYWQADNGPEYSQMLVKYDISHTNNVSDIHSLATEIQAEVMTDYADLNYPGLYLIRVPGERDVLESVSFFTRQPGVVYAEPDYPIRFDRIPDDPDFIYQWGLYNTGQVYKPNGAPGIPGADVKATDAWNISTGTKDVVIAVLDTGIDYYHPDLSGNLWTDPVTGAHGYNVLDGSYDPLDLWGHGTHCAGIIGAAGNNSIGGTGACWNVSIMGVKVGQSWEGTISGSIYGILWAAQHGADIMSCSWGESKPSRALEEVMANTDALFVCAAGNTETDIDQKPYYPASYDLPNVISVAATSPFDTLADFSNYGAKSVDVGAPGVDIFSTWKGQSGSDVFWHDSFETLTNWSYIGDWHLDYQEYNTSPSSVCVNITFQDPSLQHYLVLHTPVNISGYSRPELIFSFGGVILWPLSTKLSVDACVDKKFEWKRIGEWAGAFLDFDDIHCDIPDEMRDSEILVRFILQEQYPPEGVNKTLRLWIDDVRFSNKTEAYTPSYRHVNGTSMAAPLVAGVAGLVRSEHQNLTPAELRETLMKTVDQKDGLKGKTLSGGRINASAAIRYTPGPDAGVLSLRSGWNQISVPDALEPGFDTARIFSHVPSGGHALYSYQPKGGYVRVNETDIIRPLNGYWIYSLSSMDVPVRFQTDPSIQKELDDGWNLIGLKSRIPVPVRDALSCLGNNWTMVSGYNASLQWYDEPILRENFGNTSDNRPLVPYQGYWILMNGKGSIP